MRTLLLIAAFSQALSAQITRYPFGGNIQYVTSAPAGACGSAYLPIQYLTTTGDQYGCVAGTWTKINAGAGITTLGVSGSGQTGATQTLTQGTGILISSAANAHTFSAATDVILSRATDQAGTDLYALATSTSATDYLAGLTPALTAYTNGMRVLFDVGGTACTGGVATTLNIDSLGAKRIYRADGTTDPASGSCPAGRNLLLVYDTALTAGAGGWRIVGGGAIVASDVPTLNQNTTGSAATITGAIVKANTPFTTKGDLWVTDGTNMNRLGVGTDGFALVADAASTNGVKWAAATGTTATTNEVVIPGANCQNGAAGTGFALPAANAPSATCVTGANAGDPSTASSAWNYGVLSFTENASAATANSVQGRIKLHASADLTTGNSVVINWRTSAITGDVVWQIQGQCIADGEVPGNFGTAAAFTADTAKGTTLQWNNTAALTIGTSDVLTGCAAGETFLYRLFRDATHASDTLAATADLISVQFNLRRTL